MSGFEGVIVSDPRLQSQFTQVELRSLKSKVFDKNAVLCCFDFWSLILYD